MTTELKYNVNPTTLYDGLAFEEYCISEGMYLPANRDRTPCKTCPLSTLCQAGFEEQVRRIQNGDNPSLTEGCVFDPEALKPQILLSGLTDEQKEFVIAKVPNLNPKEKI
ncbi:MAG: hypothetical protein H0U45_14565 [Tatlockia sp.]|jgi:hypothetical protein|nr:hypothetical protein [Tatlockia sp.]